MCKGQNWHTDGPHLFSSRNMSNARGQGDDYTDSFDDVPLLTPTHAVNIFIPLVDMKPGKKIRPFFPSSNNSNASLNA